MDTLKRKKEELWVDVLKAVSCLAVVYLHVNAYMYWRHCIGDYWFSSNFIEAFCYFAAPCFLMISGYALMDYRERYDTKVFLKKRFFRTFAPFVLWSFVFFDLYHKHNFLLSFIGNEIIFEYWFFYCLLTCYLSIIFFSQMPNKIKNFTWLFIWSFITISIIPLLRDKFAIATGDNPIGGDHLIFIFSGYVLGKKDLSKAERIIIYCLGIAGMLLHFSGAVFLPVVDGKVNEFFSGYRNFPTVLYSAAVFVFVRYTNWDWILKNKITKFLLEAIVSCSLGIYLLHTYIVYTLLPNIFTSLGYPELTDGNTYRIIAPTFITLFICFSIIAVAKIIPQKYQFLLGYSERKYQ